MIRPTGSGTGDRRRRGRMRRRLNQLNFEFRAENPKDLPVEFLHYGVVGSGDMEVIMERKPLNGAVKVMVRTPISGFDEVWRKVLNRFVNDAHIGNVTIEINDSGAPPAVGSLRLRQALLETL
jgi:malonate decarboxylase delta subunit